MTDLLLIDADALLAELVRGAFSNPVHRVRVAPSGREALRHLRGDFRPEVILLASQLPDGSGHDVFAQIRALDVRVPVIFISTGRAATSAIEAMKHGAFDYLYRPVEPARLRDAVSAASAIARPLCSASFDAEDDGDEYEGALSGTSPAMATVYKAIGRVAAQDVTVLITGESGTGKELVARAVYQHSSRANGPFMALNCAAIPEHLLESELFGHEKGAFTGADRRRIGKFEQCQGGTLLLDEIGDMPLGLQAKILRVLQEKSFERVGSGETIQLDVRIIAATHRDLRSRAASADFRADLYYRLNVFTIQLPSLRERGDDLRLLIAHYLKRFNRELGREVRALAPETLDCLHNYEWPGNVRELQSVLKIALLNSTGPVLLPCFLPPLATFPSATLAAPTARVSPDLDELIARGLNPDATALYAETHGHVDRLLLLRTLKYTYGNHREAAKLLGISRQTMRVKLRALGLSVVPSVQCEGS